MNSSLERIQLVRKHPNADRLDLVKVLGYLCIVGADSFKAGDPCIFIQPDSQIPMDREWTEPYRKFVAPSGRVRSVKIRNIWSMGLVLSPNGILEGAYSEGQDLDPVLGVTKYEVVGNDLAVRGGLPFEIPKTDEIRWQNMRDLPLGSVVDITLKVDGSSFTAYYDLKSDTFGVTSRSQDLDLTADNKWVAMAKRLDLHVKLKEYCSTHGISLALRGELYGHGVQSGQHNPHSNMELGVLFFSSYLIQEMRYSRKGEQHYFRKVCSALDLPTVPVLEEDVVLTYDLIGQWCDREEVNGLPFEGVVIQGETFSFKIINPSYDSKKA